VSFLCCKFFWAQGGRQYVSLEAYLGCPPPLCLLADVPQISPCHPFGRGCQLLQQAGTIYLHVPLGMLRQPCKTLPTFSRAITAPTKSTSGVRGSGDTMQGEQSLQELPPSAVHHSDASHTGAESQPCTNQGILLTCGFERSCCTGIWPYFGWPMEGTPRQPMPAGGTLEGQAVRQQGSAPSSHLQSWSGRSNVMIAEKRERRAASKSCLRFVAPITTAAMHIYMIRQF
jgi:hypothetical protein